MGSIRKLMKQFMIIGGQFIGITFNFYCHNNLMNTLKKMNQTVTISGKYLIHFDQVLGRGATSTVFRGQTIDKKHPIAIKLIDLSQNCDIAQRSLLQNQCKALRLLDHPHLVKLIDIVEQENKFYIITKVYEGVTLAEHIHSQTMSQESIVQAFKKIIEAIAYLIEKNILHRDLKPSNIIIDRNMNPIIIDFGFCEIIHEAKISRVFNVGSPSYMAPEAYLRTLYSQKSQSWSLAMILYEMLHKRTLDRGVAIKDFYENIRNVEGYVSNQIDRAVGAELKEMMEKSFKYNSMDRLSITGIKYCIDLYLLNRKRRGQKLVHAPSTVDFRHSKQVIKFNQQPAQTITNRFQLVSPLKRRQVSVKFIPPQISKQNIGNNINETNKQQEIPLLQMTSTSSNGIANIDYFSNKIKKGVFDLKRFSRTQRDVLAPYSNANNMPVFATQHKLIIKLA